jgi:hypothetical protein
MGFPYYYGQFSLLLNKSIFLKCFSLFRQMHTIFFNPSIAALVTARCHDCLSDSILLFFCISDAVLVVFNLFLQKNISLAVVDDVYHGFFKPTSLPSLSER